MRHGHGSIPDTTPRRGAGTLAGPRAASAAGTISASAEPPDWGTNQRPAHPGQSHLITSDGRPCFPIRLISRHEAAKWCLCFMPRNLLSSSVALPSLSLLLVQRLFSLGSLWTACSFPTPVRHGSPYYVSPRGVARDLGIPRVGGDASEHALYESRVECNDLQYVGPPF